MLNVMLAMFLCISIMLCGIVSQPLNAVCKFSEKRNGPDKGIELLMSPNLTIQNIEASLGRFGNNDKLC